MMRRVSTGVPRLDTVLGGGLVANSIALITGAPGSGKTILAGKWMFANATTEHPGLYLSTVSEPFDKIVSYSQSLSFFEVGVIGKSVFYEDLGEALVDGGLVAVLRRIDELVRLHRPGFVVIDSFKAMKAFGSDEADFRRFLRDLSGRFTAQAISSMWVGEYDSPAVSDSPEFAVADAVLTLETRRSAERSVRYLSVRKLRGSSFLSGDHVFRVTDDGLEVFPRLADQGDGHPFPRFDGRVSTGVPALDDSVEQGFWPGSTTLIAGPSGTGKTLMGLHFLYEGGRRDEPGILLTLQENRTQLARITEGFGWSMEDRNVTVLDRSPVALYIDELIYELLDCIEQLGARRVVVDALGDLESASPDPTRFSEFVYSLGQRCARQGVSLMMTYETAELFRTTRLSHTGMSHISDNVILLQYVQQGSAVKRAMCILKTRGSVAATGVRQFEITTKGIVLGDPIDPQSVRDV
jgi:circadian clock protein KaiC